MFDDPYLKQQAELAMRQLLDMLESRWNVVSGDLTGLPYGDSLTLRRRLTKAALTAEDEAYLIAVANAITSDDPVQVKLRELLLAVPETGVTLVLADNIFAQLPAPKQRSLEYYTAESRLKLLRVLYLLMLRSGFWAIKHDHNGPIDTLSLGIDPLHVPEHTVESFQARMSALKGIEELTGMASHLHWNILQVLPRLVDENVASFLSAYEEWWAEEGENAGLDQDGFA